MTILARKHQRMMTHPENQIQIVDTQKTGFIHEDQSVTAGLL